MVECAGRPIYNPFCLRGTAGAFISCFVTQELFPPSFFSSSSITKFWSVYGSAVEVDEELADCSQRGRYAHPSILALSRTPSVQPIGQVNKPISHFFFAQPQCFLYLYKFVRCHFLRVRSVLPWIHCEIFYLFFCWILSRHLAPSRYQTGWVGFFPQWVTQ